MTLKEAREKRNFTQTYVAKKVGVSVVAYQLWEKEVSTPKPENQEKLAALLHLPADFFN